MIYYFKGKCRIKNLKDDKYFKRLKSNYIMNYLSVQKWIMMKQESILLNKCKNKYLNKNIEFLELDNSILLQLKANNINTIEDI